ncbi:MAG: DUF4412 domain-containing protein [Chitinophagales bacterium]
MQKRISMMIVLLLVGSLVLVGCGKSNKETSAPTDKSTAPKQSSVQKESKIDSELTKLMNAARNIKGMSYEMTMSGSGVNSTMKVWQNGKKMRTEAEANGQKSIIIINPEKDLYCNYIPSANMAMTYDESTKKSMKNANANQWSEEGVTDYKITGSEKCNGYDCKVIKGRPGGIRTRIWVREDLGVPVKIESIDHGKTVKIEFKNYIIGPQDDSFFELPVGVQMTDMQTVFNTSKTQ